MDGGSEGGREGGTEGRMNGWIDLGTQQNAAGVKIDDITAKHELTCLRFLYRSLDRLQL